MTTFDPFTPVPVWPEHAMTATERKAMQREADVMRQASIVTRISAAQLGIHTEPTPVQRATSERKQRIRRRRVRYALYLGKHFGIGLIQGFAAVMFALGVTYTVISIFVH